MHNDMCANNNNNKKQQPKLRVYEEYEFNSFNSTGNQNNWSEKSMDQPHHK